MNITTAAAVGTTSRPSPSRRVPRAPADPDADTARALRRAFDAAPVPTLVIGTDAGRVLRANAAAGRLFARATPELVGRGVHELYPDARASLYTFTDEAVERGHAWTRELALVRPDGRPFRLEHLAVRVELEGQACIHVTITDLDALVRRDVSAEADAWHRAGLSEWHRAERYFREVERDNRLILAAVGDGIYGVDAEGVATFVNPAAEAMLGYAADELVGEELHALIHHHKSDGSPYPSAECPIYGAFRQGRVNTVDDEVFFRRDGRAIRVEYTSTPIVDSGVVVGAVVVFRDITARKRAEERLSATLQENARLRERLEQENAYLQEEIRTHANHREILGASEAIAHVLRQIDLVGPTEANVLVTGESGTGKELVARAIHEVSNRKGRPLIRVNCAAIPRELFESEFFGHVRGSFSGAVRDRVGRFELADGGTLLLDEVGEIPLDLQSKLLRVLQEGTFERVGEERTRKVDVRLVAATNRDLQEEVRAGRFREDLYFRLNVFPIECAPLRHRPADVPPLAAHFLRLACARLNVPVPRLTRANMRALQGYAWPGNARELQNVVERAAILARDGKLRIDLPAGGDALASPPEHPPAVAPERVLDAAEMRAFERDNIARALASCGGRVAGERGAAVLLGLRPSTLASRMKALGVARPVSGG